MVFWMRCVRHERHLAVISENERMASAIELIYCLYINSMARVIASAHNLGGYIL